MSTDHREAAASVTIGALGYSRTLREGRLPEPRARPDDLRRRWRPADCFIRVCNEHAHRRLARDCAAGLKVYDDR